MMFRRSGTRLLSALLGSLASLVLVLVSMPALAQSNASKRVALLIGNGAYEHVAALRNPANDSSDLAASLSQVGFDVTLHTDQSQASMLETLRSFRRKANGAEIALIYYAGHGIEIDRQNYLIPVDAELETYADINFEAVPLETMIFAASGAKRLSMVIVDACRDNPFAASMERGNSTRSIGRGLSAVEPTKNTLVAYAAKEGTTAADGEGRNSPYASALIASLKQPNLEVGLMMRQVRDAVLDTTNGAQEPFVYGSLSADQIYLNETRGLSPVTTDTAALAPAPAPALPATGDARAATSPDASAGEIAFWQSISGTAIREELESYLAAYPNGLFVELARARLARLGTGGGASGAGGADPTAPQDPFAALVPQPQTPPPTVQADPAPAPVALPSPEVDRDLTRPEIRELQERLSVLGHSLGRADGLAGRRTQAAIRAFEQSASLPVTGAARLRILTALQESVSDEDLRDWRAKQVRVTPPTPPRETTARTQPRAQTPSATLADPILDTTPQLSAGDQQFCNGNRQCGTPECRVGTSGKVWRKTANCRFCSRWAGLCQ